MAALLRVGRIAALPRPSLHVACGAQPWYGGSNLGCARAVLAHKDHQALTVLVPLTSPQSDFEGGGTAFWAQDSRGFRVEPPSLTLRPPAGTCLLFGGHTTHAGTPVVDGERCVLVASFSRLGGRAQRVEDAARSRDIYGDLI